MRTRSSSRWRPARTASATSPLFRAASRPPWTSICCRRDQAARASCSVSASSAKLPPPGSPTAPRWASSRSTSCRLRATLPPCSPSRSGASIRSAPPTTAAKVAAVRRSALVGADQRVRSRAAGVAVCARSASTPDSSATRAHTLRVARRAAAPSRKRLPTDWRTRTWVNASANGVSWASIARTTASPPATASAMHQAWSAPASCQRVASMVNARQDGARSTHHRPSSAPAARCRSGVESRAPDRPSSPRGSSPKSTRGASSVEPTPRQSATIAAAAPGPPSPVSSTGTDRRSRPRNATPSARGLRRPERSSRSASAPPSSSESTDRLNTSASPPIGRRTCQARRGRPRELGTSAEHTGPSATSGSGRQTSRSRERPLRSRVAASRQTASSTCTSERRAP
jgi:hypothetical protein